VNVVFAALHDALTERERLRISYSTPQEEIVDVAYYPENVDGSYSVSIPQGAGIVEAGDFERYTVVVYDGAGNRLKKEHAPVEHYGCRCGGAAAPPRPSPAAALAALVVAAIALIRRRGRGRG
jgi:MYXO-CTERM domain-containing protein